MYIVKLIDFGAATTSHDIRPKFWTKDYAYKQDISFYGSEGRINRFKYELF